MDWLVDEHFADQVKHVLPVRITPVLLGDVSVKRFTIFPNVPSV